MSRPEPKRLSTAALVDRLREILNEVEDGRREGLDLMFGNAPERGGIWLLFEREADADTAGPRSACCGTAPKPMPRDAAAGFLRETIELIGREPLFDRANLQFRPDTPDNYLAFVEVKVAMDWRMWGQPRVHQRIHRRPPDAGAM
jgi:hypothetical protein